MAQPFNYSLGVQSPMEAGQNAYQTELQGLNVQAQMQAAQAQAIAAQQKAQQEALRQQQWQEVSSRVLSPDATAADYQRAMLLGNKDQAETLAMMFKSRSENENRASISKIAPVVFALNAGKPESAVSILERQKSAYQDNPEVMQELDNQIAMINADPQSAVLQLGGALSLIPGGDKVLENALKLTQERRAESEAKKIKLAPSIQEAIDFKNLPPEDKQVFLSLKTLSRPPAAVTNVNVTNLDKSAATQLGELVPKLHDQANSAAGQIAQLPRYRRALDSAITGPLADTRLTSARVASALGFDGDKAVAATTELMQGLAEMSLQSRSMLTGQGQITEYEQRLLVQARSGNLNLTKPELQTIFDVADRAARAQYTKSRNLLQSAANKSETAALFLQNVSELPAESKPQQPQGQGVSVTTPDGKRFVFPSKQAAEEFKRRAGVQ